MIFCLCPPGLRLEKIINVGAINKYYCVGAFYAAHSGRARDPSQGYVSVKLNHIEAKLLYAEPQSSWLQSCWTNSLQTK